MNRIANRIRARILHSRLLSAIFYLPIKVRRFFLERRTRHLEKAYLDLMRYTESGTVTAHVPGFGYALEFDVRSDILKRIVILGEYEKSLLEIVDEHLRPELDVLDIGANVGVYTVYFARKIGTGRRVLAIEPMPDTLNLLKRNLSMHNLAGSIIVYEGVAAEKAGRSLITSIPGKEEYSTLGDHLGLISAGNVPRVELEVVGETVDDLVERYNLTPGFMKLDIEGAEYLALAGAKTTLKKYHPVIMAELVDKYLARFGHSAKDVVDLLLGSGYHVMDVATGEPPLHPFDGEILALAK